MVSWSVPLPLREIVVVGISGELVEIVMVASFAPELVGLNVTVRSWFISGVTAKGGMGDTVYWLASAPDKPIPVIKILLVPLFVRVTVFSLGEVVTTS